MSDLLSEFQASLSSNIARMKDEQVKAAIERRTLKPFDIKDMVNHKFELFVRQGKSDYGGGMDCELYIMDGKPLLEIHDKPIEVKGKDYITSIGVRRFE